jgi:fatty acid synthase, animal type
VVLNSLSEDKLQASVRLLAQHGRFLEIGKFDLSQNNPLYMDVFLKNIGFHGILLDSLFESHTDDWTRVHRLVQHGIDTSIVCPLHVNVFDSNEVEQAFRFMSQGKHVGKVVLKVMHSRVHFSFLNFPFLRLGSQPFSTIGLCET